MQPDNRTAVPELEAWTATVALAPAMQHLPVDKRLAGWRKIRRVYSKATTARTITSRRRTA
jgi:hypothetical protein